MTHFSILQPPEIDVAVSEVINMKDSSAEAYFACDWRARRE